MVIVQVYDFLASRQNVAKIRLFVELMLAVSSWFIRYCHIGSPTTDCFSRTVIPTDRKNCKVHSIRVQDFDPGEGSMY